MMKVLFPGIILSDLVNDDEGHEVAICGMEQPHHVVQCERHTLQVNVIVRFHIFCI